MSRRFSLALALFLVSGTTGLLYEVAFSKLLGYVFGATAYAVSTVLAAFMAGMAGGAFLGGKLGPRIKRPLVAYGVLEIVVGIVCAASPTVLAALSRQYVEFARSSPGSLGALTLARGLLTALIVIVPTLAMGATLPLLARVVAGADDEAGNGSLAARLPVLYATNTAGGALGSMLAAYVALPTLGIRTTMLGAAATNVVLGLIAVGVGLRTAPDGAREPAASQPEPAAPADDAGVGQARLLSERLAIALAFGSGYLVFAAEVVQTHLLALLIGNSAFAFGLMLAVFLTCLGLGAARAPRFARVHGASAMPRALALTALAIALTLPLWDQLPHVFAFAGHYVRSFAGREAVRALVALGILCVPTVLMGTTFPLLLEHVARTAKGASVAAGVGRITMWNTLGTIAGSLVTGYVILPWLGSQWSLVAIAVVFAVLGAATARAAAPSLRAARVPLALAGAGALIALLVPHWNLGQLTNGANVYFARGTRIRDIEFVREDVHGGVTTVVRHVKTRTLYTNGKFQGNDTGEVAAQRRFAHFPSLFVQHENRALVIGLGTGTTVGTIAAYPYAHIDVAEISPAIVEASQRFFELPNRGALRDPRVRLIMNDGRNVLLVEREPYDLVTIELTSVWFAGAASLYSREFYQLVASRLTEGGILQQWVQLHHIRPRELGVIVRTLRSVFPHVAFFVGGGQGILVAGRQPLMASAARLDRLEAIPAVKETLGEHSMRDLFQELVTSGPSLDRLIEETAQDGGPIVSTDDNLYLEYATPQGNALPTEASVQASMALLEKARIPDPRSVHLGP